MNNVLKAAIFAAAVGFTACSEEKATGKLSLYLTDAPIDAENIEAVVLSVIRVEAHGPAGWTTVSEFDPPLQINLLDYQNGSAYFLTENIFPAGTYKEVRLILNAPQQNGAPVSNPGCYLQYTDQTKTPIYVPSGAQTGYKAKGSFTLPPAGTVAVTLDFDLRKSIVKAGQSGIFLLKPVIRLVANQNASMIRGTISLPETYSKLVAYAYPAGTFSPDEAANPQEGMARFPNATTSATVAQNGTFTLSFLEAGTYHLIFAAFDETGEFNSLVGKYGPVEATAGSITELVITAEMLTEL